MKLLFVYPDLVDDNPNYKGNFSFSVAYLSAYLKARKHTTSLLHIFQPITKEQFSKRIKDEKPDLICFSSISLYADYINVLSKWAKEVTDKLTIFGGVHATLVPEKCIQMEGIDIVCVGEGEQALAQLCDKLEKKEDITHISSLWVKQGQGIFKNPCGALIENLDEIPMVDRDLFDFENLEGAQKHMRHKTIFVMASRGCPFSCYYCCNHIIRERYPNKSKYVRFMTVDKFIKELVYLKNRYPYITDFTIIDDVLPLYNDWLKEFVKKYKKYINMPFRCQIRIDIANEETVRLLKEAGCYRLQFGLEHGNVYLLKNILNRTLNLEKAKIIVKLCKQLSIQTSTYNMVGFPEETLLRSLDTIKANVYINSDVQNIYAFYPFEGTKLYDIAKSQGLLPEKKSKRIFFAMEDSMLNLKDMTHTEVLFVVRFFRLFVLLYKTIYKQPKLIRKPAEKFVDFIYLSKLTPRRLLNYIQKKYFRDYLLTIQYKNFEKKYGWVQKS